MIKFIRSLPYHIKNAFKSIKRNIAMSISSATAVTVTLILIMLFLVIAVNINTMSDKVEKSVEIFVQLDLIVEENQYDDIQKEIEAIPNVKSVRFSSPEEQKKIFLESDLGGEEYASMFEEGNPLAAAFYIEVSEGQYISKVAKQCRNIDGVLKAEFGGDTASEMLDAFNSIKYGGAIFVAALCFLAIFLISNTIKITIQARRQEIGIMRNVGASNGFIKTPLIIEGIIISIIGSVVPILLTIFGYGFVYDVSGGYMFSSLFELEPPIPFAIYVSLVILLLGVIVGMIGSLLSVNKYLKWER
ncbi:MAG: ABC transporter permease [Erysipelotrichia bacterium]|nr:ABC transporter permease [Erysipelotrichia bacterium]NCC54393.1 ABC transporter permease [Erysipelotrichia bacterium]